MHTARVRSCGPRWAVSPRRNGPLFGSPAAGCAASGSSLPGFAFLSAAAFMGLVVGSVVIGCKPGANRPATVPVSGTVTLKGSPIAGATVSFQAVDGSRSSVAITDESGRYELTTFVRGDGAVPGEYKVAVTKVTQAVVESVPGAKYEPPSGPIPEPKNQLPAKYADADKSGLKFTVTNGSNAADFSLAP